MGKELPLALDKGDKKCYNKMKKYLLSGETAMSMHPDVEKILIDEQTLDEVTTRLAAEIDRDYKDSKHLVLVCILKGSIMFMSDLMKKVTVPVEIDCMKASSYGSGTTSGGTVHIYLDLLRSDLPECDLLIIEDIIDSGNTLNYLVKYLKGKGAKSVKTCTLLDKPSRRVIDLQPDYCGCVIPDEFVIGYGLDYDEKYRALPYVGILRRSVYEK